MKYFLLISLFLHTGSGSWSKPASFPEVNLLQVRLAPWQINIQRYIYYTDTCFAIQFRDQSLMNSVNMKTLSLETMQDLKYVRDGLLILRKGNTGDVAEYKNFSLKKVGTKKENTWYILNYDGAVTNFQEAQANRMIYIINSLIAGQ